MRVAAVDLGTNTARLLVVDVVDGVITELVRSVEIVGLGRGVDATGAISTDALDRLQVTLGRFRSMLDRLHPERVDVIATSAARDASNRDELAAAVRHSLRHEPRVIDGVEEAALAFEGAVGSLGSGGVTLVIDPGGGSTEFVLGAATPTYLTSVDIGSVRLSDRLLPHRPAAPTDVDAARAHVRQLVARVELPDRHDHVIGVAGTFTSLAGIHLDGEEQDPPVHGVPLSVEEVDAMVGRLRVMSVDETAAIPALHPERAPVILAGAIIVSESLRHVGAEHVVVSEADSLDGMVRRISRV